MLLPAALFTALSNMLYTVQAIQAMQNTVNILVRWLLTCCFVSWLLTCCIVRKEKVNKSNAATDLAGS
jgi:hypothetical protein